MVDGAEAMGTGLRTGPRDPRITRVGRFLRALSLDEVPQLMNVVLGEMRLVGPRPAPPVHLERYTEDERLRLLVPPGITGLAQVSGRNRLTWHERIALDVKYVQKRSLCLDLWVLWRTFFVVLRRDGVYSGRQHAEGGRS